MSIYITLAIIFLILSFCFKNNSIIAALLCLVLFIMSGWRDLSVGTDTLNYLRIFETDYLSEQQEISWRILRNVCHNNGLSFDYLLIFLSALVILPIFFTAKMESRNSVLTITLFLLLYFFCNSMNTIRQSIANSFLLLSYVYFLRNNYKFLILYAVIAVSFHISAIIYLPFFFLSKLKFSKLSLILITVFSFLIGFFNIITPILDFMLVGWLDKYSVYLGDELIQRTETFSISRLLLNVWTIALIAFHKKNNPYLILLMFGCVILNLFYFSPIIGRLSQFFILTQILIIPNSRFLVQKKYQLPIYYGGIIYACIIYFYLLSTNISEVVPYKFNLTF